MALVSASAVFAFSSSFSSGFLRALNISSIRSVTTKPPTTLIAPNSSAMKRMIWLPRLRSFPVARSSSPPSESQVSFCGDFHYMVPHNSATVGIGCVISVDQDRPAIGQPFQPGRSRNPATASANVKGTVSDLTCGTAFRSDHEELHPVIRQKTDLVGAILQTSDDAR